ncbi:HNH endonuclease signature motif containing protein, partial [Pseudonocardia hydrocarbonoxydans]|uniref:HNH endonuclease signature motif containing protein n=1 Tax=Pseudonocardia hydrocarbonoxydans TaxID=76726 RepID=UPI0031D2C489
RARLIADRVALLPDAVATAVQDRVLPRAPGQTWAQLDAALRRAITAIDPEGAADRHRAAKNERRVDVFAQDDGMATLWARMTAPDAAASFEWLTRLARGMGADDDRSLDQRRADLLAAALTGKLVIRDPTADPVMAAPVTPGKPLITVLVPYSALTGADDAPGEITGYGPIPAQLARDIAADAVWKRLLVDPVSGAVLDHGRATYRPPAALADLVRARDVTCRHPRCRRAATACELDHVTAWQDGGGTSEDNLAALCTAHHDLKEQPGWRVVLRPDRSVEWTTPTGHTYRTEPHDHRG